MSSWVFSRALAVVASCVVVSGVVPVVAQADPKPRSASCTVEQLTDLQQQVSDLNGRIAAHNGMPVDRTDAGAVAQYNAEADALEHQRAALQAQIAACQKALDDKPMPTMPSLPPMPNIPGMPGSTSNDGVQSRGSGPLFVWVAVSSGNLADDSGNVSPEQGLETARRYQIPDRVVDATTFAPYKGRTMSDMYGQYLDLGTGRWKWPENHGFEHTPLPQPFFLPKLVLSGFLDTDPESGLFGEDTPYRMRSLAPGTLGPYVKVEGTGKRMPANYHLLTDTVGPAFGMPGRGDKYLVINTDTNRIVPIATLIAEGYLKKVA